jgi:hypothetical protein
MATDMHVTKEMLEEAFSVPPVLRLYNKDSSDEVDLKKYGRDRATKIRLT